MGKVFEIIRPKSLDDPAYEDHEYLIRWIGRNGADYLFMFYDAEFQREINNDIINSEDEERIESLIEDERRQIILDCNDLSLNDLQIISSLLSNKYVTRLKKDGTIERYAPVQNSFEYTLSNGRYDLQFKLRLSDLTILR